MIKSNFSSQLLSFPDLWFSLQHFASPENEGRTEEPSESKIRKARREGRVAKSSDLAPTVVMCLSLFFLFFTASSFVEVISDMMRYFFVKISILPISSLQTFDSDDFKIFFGYYFRLVFPILSLVFFVSIIVMVIQVGFVFTWKPLIPDFSRVVPNFSRYFSKTFSGFEAFYNLGKSLAKVILVLFISYLIVSMQFTKFLSTSLVPLLKSSRFLFVQIFIVMIIASLVFFVLALVDLFFQKWQYKRQLKMTKQEVRDEVKEDEGNPIFKSRIKTRMMDYLRATMMRNVEHADVIVTNPTHIAVALQYAQGARAPKLTAKGQNRVALRIRDLAQNSKIPIIENKPLARALYENIDVGQEIPPEYWEVVSTIFAQVYRMMGKSIEA